MAGLFLERKTRMVDVLVASTDSGRLTARPHGHRLANNVPWRILCPQWMGASWVCLHVGRASETRTFAVEAEPLDIDGVVLLRADRHEDERGFLSEVYNRRALEQIGIRDDFVQENHIRSHQSGTIRGLHFQIKPHPAAKLLRVVRGAIFDVVVDLRHDSPTYGEHVTVELSEENWTQIYIPVGLAHGLCTLESNTEITYRVSDYWSPNVDRGVLWNDPHLEIDWPVSDEKAIVSDKDWSQPRLADLPRFFEKGE